MPKVREWLSGSAYTPPISPACELCAEGSELVLLITGKCPAKCYYCPLSGEKSGKDRVFANELEIVDKDGEDGIEKTVREAGLIDAQGAGITGGDPLVVWERTEKYITGLKEYFGPEFNIHLYTSGLVNGDKIERLVAAGLDEIRFHPHPDQWNNMDDSPVCQTIRECLEMDIETAVEIPVIPGTERDIISLVRWASDQGINWINLNELEYSESNTQALRSRDMKVKDDISYAVKGSEETARKVLGLKDLDIGIHYCTSSFKDGIQLRNRINRRAENIARDYEVITKDGTILKGIIITLDGDIDAVYQDIKDRYDVEGELIDLNRERRRIEIAAWILEDIAKNLVDSGLHCYLIEEYPTADRLEVERSPLPIEKG